MSLRDLNAYLPMAPNFQYKEFVYSYEAERLLIENIPNEEQWQNIEETAKVIAQPLRDRFGRIRITSGFRCPDLNDRVGSGSTSHHLTGRAIDIKPLAPKVTLMKLILHVYNYLPFRELIAEYFPHGWVHAAYIKGDNSAILKLKDANHDFKVVTIDYLIKLYGR